MFITLTLELLTLAGHTDKLCNAVVFSPNGKWIVTGSADRTAKIWDAATGRVLRTLSGHGGIIRSVAVSADNRRIATGSYDLTVKVWDIEAGEELLTLKGHGDTIVSLAFSPNGSRLVAGSWGEAQAKIWPAATREQVADWPVDEATASLRPPQHAR